MRKIGILLSISFVILSCSNSRVARKSRSTTEKEKAQISTSTLSNKISKTQKNTNMFINNTFWTKIGYMCQETSKPDSCAGKQIYLSLYFEKEKVTVNEVYISSCNEVESFYIEKLNWKLQKDACMQIYADTETGIKYYFLNNIIICMNNKDQKIEGYTQDGKTVIFDKNRTNL